MMNQEPIFILGAHKSGTTLLRNLFDGHSQMFTIPVESHFFQLKGHWVDNEYRSQKPAAHSREVLINKYTAWIQRCNETFDPLADAFARGLFDMDTFRESMTSCNAQTEKEWMSLYFQSIYTSIYTKPIKESIRIIEKSVEHAEFALNIKTMFPEAKFIHIIRNPYANLVSLRKFKSKKFGYPILPRLLKTLYNNFYFMYKNESLINDYHIVRYEDLLTQPEDTIRSLCVFAGIEEEPILFRPTFQGTDWQGNSTTGRKYTGIYAGNLEAWKKSICPIEIDYVNRLFDYILEDYDYEKIPSPAKFWRPVRGETLKRYLANRVYRYFLFQYDNQ